MIYSTSGLVEKGAVFSTPHHDKNETVWMVTNYDTEKFQVDFSRLFFKALMPLDPEPRYYADVRHN